MTASLRATRELWLENAINEFRTRFDEIGFPLPEQIHVSVGFGYGARRENAKILGQAWKRMASDDKVNHVFISPETGDTAQILATLLHELIHVADDCESGHKGAFAEMATRLGLQAPLTGVAPSVELAAELMCIAAELGAYPHGKLDTTLVREFNPVGPDGKPVPGGKTHSGPRKQGTRMMKLVCGHCGYTVRTTARWLTVGNPRCPEGEEMTLV